VPHDLTSIKQKDGMTDRFDLYTFIAGATLESGNPLPLECAKQIAAALSSADSGCEVAALERPDLVYSDRCSGAKDRRPGLYALMADARRAHSTLSLSGVLTDLPEVPSSWFLR
jgi:hypothetical protein